MRALGRYFAALLAVLLLGGTLSFVVGLAGLRALNAEIDSIVQEDVYRIISLTDLRRAIRSLLRADQDLLLADTPEKRAERTARAEQAEALLVQALAQAGALYREPSHPNWDALHADADEHLRQSRALRLSIQAGQHQQALHRYESLSPAWEEHNRILLAEARTALAEKASHASTSYHSTRGILLATFSVATLTGLAAGAFLYRRIRRTVEEVHTLKDQLLTTNAGLEARVQERTAELRAANAELESFAYAVSHDLRAPLRAMSGFSQALEEDYGPLLDDEAKDYLRRIVAASHNMGELIDGLLALSRQTRGELQREAIDLSALCSRLLDELQRTSPQRAVRCEIEPKLTLYGDARMIEAAFRNLLGNAWKYTEKQPAPEIRVFASTKDGARAVAIRDNGAGFEMKFAAKLFQPFQRLHRKDEFAGLGIGLATVQRIIHRHGGQVSAEAAPGQGATFWISLPEPTPDEGAPRT